MELLAGNSNLQLAQEIANKLALGFGTHSPPFRGRLCRRTIRNFADGEIYVEIEENVRGGAVWVIQSVSHPVNDNLMEVLILIDALRRASASEINVVIPYYGYARQERKVVPRTAITAKLVANLLSTAGATRVLTMDLHAGSIQGFFDIPVDNLYASPVLKKEISLLPTVAPTVFVSPDAGGVERVRNMAKGLDVTVAMIDKRRTGPNQAKAMNLVGDVKGKIAVIIDDMIDTAGTLVEAANTLKEHGATHIHAVATHGVFSGPAISRIIESPIDGVLVTDTIVSRADIDACTKIKRVSIAPLFAEAIQRIHQHESVSSLFQ
jgi:ribose-phosphate pyrophosphokinase